VPRLLRVQSRRVEWGRVPADNHFLARVRLPSGMRQVFTFVAWFQLGELRRRSMGLISTNGRGEGLFPWPFNGDAFEMRSG
jgi:hypothetical protein